MMKKIRIALVVVMILTIAAATLVGCGLFKDISFDDAKTNLENAGYTVVVMTGEEYVETEDAYPTILSTELVKCLHAVKGNEEIRIFVFNSVDHASDNYSFMSDNKLTTTGQSNEVVYLATKQAKKDAQI